MNKNNEKQAIEKYAEDIKIIKSLLMKVEEKPIIENWAFYTWGGFILMGTILHYIFREIYQAPIENLLIQLWIPVLLIAELFEIVAWIKKMSRESMPFFARLDIKFWLNVIGCCTVVSFLTFILIKIGGLNYLPIYIQLFFGMFMLFYAQISHFHLYAAGYFLILSGIIFYSIGINIDILYMAVGLTLGITLIISGIFSSKKEKKGNE